MEEQGVDQADLDETIDYGILENLWTIAFGRYLEGSGDPTTDFVTVSAGKQKCKTVMDDSDPVYRTRLFLEAATASPYLPVDRDEGIKVRPLSATV